MGKKTKYKNLAILKLSKIVHLLGKILGIVIKEQEKNKIEWDKKVSSTKIKYLQVKLSRVISNISVF